VIAFDESAFAESRFVSSVLVDEEKEVTEKEIVAGGSAARRCCRWLLSDARPSSCGSGRIGFEKQPDGMPYFYVNPYK
jgi:hypothetical protein